MAHPDFRPPGKSVKLTGRKSTLTGLFFVSLTPCINPTDSEVDEALAVLGMSRGRVKCAYCGGRKTEWDHFRPIVKGRRPTGYITEIANLVPACGKCNQSKRGEYWKTWMLGDADNSPKKLGVKDLRKRVRRLEAFERWRKPVCIAYSRLGTAEQWRRHMRYLDKVLALLERAERHAAIIRRAALAKVARRR